MGTWVIMNLEIQNDQVLIISNTQGRQSSQNFNLLLEVFYFCGFLFFSPLTCISSTTWQFCFPYVCLQKIAIHRKCVADTWLQGAVNDSIFMVIMQQPSLRDTVCIPQSLQKATPKWQGFRMFLFIRFESNPVHSSAHSLWKAKSTNDTTSLKRAQQETGNFMTLPLKAVKGGTCIFTSWPISILQSFVDWALASTMTLNMVHIDWGTRKSVDRLVFCSFTSNAILVLWRKVEEDVSVAFKHTEANNNNNNKNNNNNNNLKQ